MKAEAQFRHSEAQRPGVQGFQGRGQPVENGKIKCDAMRAQKRCSPEEEMV